MLVDSYGVMDDTLIIEVHWWNEYFMEEKAYAEW
jgi:hypothetical protein